MSSPSQTSWNHFGFPSEQLRVACDFANFSFVYDEFADVLDKEAAREQANIVMDAFRNPAKPRPEGESIIGEITRQYVFFNPRSASRVT